MFSSALKNLGFSRASEEGLSINHSPNIADRGTFYHGNFLGFKNTTAVDENGDMWTKKGHVDLSPFGFRPFSGEHAH